jgi:hypothetical protein
MSFRQICERMGARSVASIQEILALLPRVALLVQACWVCKRCVATLVRAGQCCKRATDRGPSQLAALRGETQLLARFPAGALLADARGAGLQRDGRRPFGLGDAAVGL